MYDITVSEPSVQDTRKCTNSCSLWTPEIVTELSVKCLARHSRKAPRDRPIYISRDIGTANNGIVPRGGGDMYALGVEKNVIARQAAKDASHHSPAVVHSDRVAHLLQL